MITISLIKSIMTQLQIFSSCDEKKNQDLVKSIICTVSSKATYVKAKFINLLQMHDEKNAVNTDTVGC